MKEKFSIIWKSLIVIFMVFFLGCSYFQKQIVTTDGKTLSNSFKSVNLILESSKEFYVTSLSIAGEAYQDGYLTEDQKNEIIKAGVSYQRIHNDAVYSLMRWYDAVNNESSDVDKQRENAIKFLFNMIEEGKVLNEVISKYLEDKTDLPPVAVPTFFNLIQALEPFITEGGK